MYLDCRNILAGFIASTLFLFFLYHGSIIGNNAIDHEICKTCHEKVYAEAMSQPFRHTVVEEKCGVCHIMLKAASRPLFNLTSETSKDEVLFPLKNLPKNSLYKVVVLARDDLGRTSRAKELDFEPFSSAEGPPPDAGYPQGMPAISDIKVEEVKQGVFPEATISWTTSAYTVGRVEYGLGTNYGEATKKDAVYSKKHKTTLYMLKKGRLYHFNIFATDLSGNVAESGDMTFDVSQASTPTASEKGKPSRTLPVVETLKVFKASDGNIYALAVLNRPSRMELSLSEVIKEGKRDEHGDGFLSSTKSHIDVCMECHPQGASHPVGISAKTGNTSVPFNLPTLDGGIITCVTCHLPHGGDRQYFERLDFQRDICIQCHKGESFF